MSKVFRPKFGRLLLAYLFFALFVSSAAHAQADPPALRQVDTSIFAGYTVVHTGLSGGRNDAVTAGVDLNLPELSRFRPSLEVRATVPIDRLGPDAQKSILGGFRFETRFERLHPYLDILGGRGQITFNGSYLTFAGTTISSQPASNVISPGAGIRVDLSSRISFLADAQFQRWSTPASLSGHLFSKPLTIGLTYRFAYGRKHPASGH